MNRSQRHGKAAGAAAFIALTMGYEGGQAAGQFSAPPPNPAGARSSSTQIVEALGRTREMGVPTIVVATSSANPPSRAFLRAFADSAWSRSNRGLIQIVELPADENPGLAQEMRLSAVPSLVVYANGPNGPACRGQRAFSHVEEAVSWLNSMGIGMAQPAPVQAGDLGLVRAAFDGGYPSSQQAQQPAAPQAPASNPAPASPYPMMAPIPAAVPAMMYPQAAPMQAQVVNLPGPNVVVQQGQPNVFVTQAPQGYGAPAAPVGNFFLPAAQPSQPPAYAPQAQPSYAVPMMAQPNYAMTALPAPVPAMAPAAFAPAGPAFAVTNQNLSLPTTRSSSTVRVRGPGLINSSLARLGERLVQRGRTTIESTQTTELGSPATQSGGGLATFSASSAIPINPPQSMTQTCQVPSAPAQAPASPEYCPPLPSPQASPQSQRKAPSKSGTN